MCCVSKMVVKSTIFAFVDRFFRSFVRCLRGGTSYRLYPSRELDALLKSNGTNYTQLANAVLHSIVWWRARSHELHEICTIWTNKSFSFMIGAQINIMIENYWMRDDGAMNSIFPFFTLSTVSRHNNLNMIAGNRICSEAQTANYGAYRPNALYV